MSQDTSDKLSEQPSQLVPPPTREQDLVEKIHEQLVADPYRWLEEQEAPETRDWIAAQNRYSTALLQHLPGRAAIRAKVTALLQIDTISSPIVRAGRYFYSKRAACQEQACIYMRMADGDERLLVDPQDIAPDSHTSVAICSVSRDGRYLVYSVRVNGKDETALKILEVDSGRLAPDNFPPARYGSVCLSPDNQLLYYSCLSEQGGRLLVHAMGSEPRHDKVIFGPGYGADKAVYAVLSDDGHWLLAHVIHGSVGATHMYLKNLQDDGPWCRMIKEDGSRSFGFFAGEHIIIQTDWQAPNKRLMITSVHQPAAEDWHELIPEDPTAVLQNFLPAGGYLVVTSLQKVHYQMAVYDLEGQKLQDVPLETMGSIGGPYGCWEDAEVFFSFSSFHLSPRIYRYNLPHGPATLWAEIKVPVDSSQMALEQIFYPSRDGTKIPMFLLYPRGRQPNPSSLPTILYGYGGFNISLTPHFMALATAWVQQGGLFAIANLRGGGEFGEKWHQAGMFEKKQNVFDDFLAAAQWLIRHQYTTPKRLGIMGGSNGGLLVAACMVQRPDLFAAVVCSNPLLDMIRYHKFMLGAFWVNEYGCSDDPEQFAYLIKYSPYHNVKPEVDYPAALFLTGDGDTRVAPLHARKMVAMLQKHNAGTRPIMLRYAIRRGHAGGDPLSQRIDELVDIISFFQWRLQDDTES